MNFDEQLLAFSANRLNGEPVPDDLKPLLLHNDELRQRTGVELNWEKDWVPWLDTSYLRDYQRTNPDIAANLRAMNDVSRLIAFIAADDTAQYFGYWRGPGNRPVSASEQP